MRVALTFSALCTPAVAIVAGKAKQEPDRVAMTQGDRHVRDCPLADGNPSFA